MFSSASVIASQHGPQKGETNEDEVPNYRSGARERVRRSAGGRQEFLEACCYEQKTYEEAHEENRGRKDGGSDSQSCSGDIVTVGRAVVKILA